MKYNIEDYLDTKTVIMFSSNTEYEIIKMITESYGGRKFTRPYERNRDTVNKVSGIKLINITKGQNYLSVNSREFNIKSYYNVIDFEELEFSDDIIAIMYEKLFELMNKL